MVTIDLKDAYLHVPIVVTSRNFLKFAGWNGTKICHFQLTSLPYFHKDFNIYCCSSTREWSHGRTLPGRLAHQSQLGSRSSLTPQFYDPILGVTRLDYKPKEIQLYSNNKDPVVGTDSGFQLFALPSPTFKDQECEETSFHLAIKPNLFLQKGYEHPGHSNSLYLSILRFGLPEIDRMATRHISKLPVFASLYRQDSPLMNLKIVRNKTCKRQIIPNPRGYRATKTACLLAVICTIILYIFGIGNYTIVQLVYSTAVYLLMVKSWYFVKNICEFFEEVFHMDTRYNGDLGRVLIASFNTKNLPFVIVSSILCCIFYEEELLPSFPIVVSFLLFLLSNILAWLLGIQDPTSAVISEITENKQLNVAHGLAWSYYIGYLKFVLPALKDSIQKFNNDNNNLLKFPEICKLHILIPLSCKMYGDLKEADENITFFKAIPPLYKDRAGIKGRVFKNNVYRILDEDHRPYYCIVEYATPLASLHQMSDIASAAFSAEDRIQQAKLFYRTLKDILENSLECRNSFRLVIYEDDEAQEPHILSKEILKHLKQQHSEEYDLIQEN
ncbi:stimulator of interferon genes protein [Spea bombifrons]|uniref:stimulator of interferon genes protein n=1 Tax=Spea bombifrons TaxID=233779 RepID=UPI00234A5D06|nr:stimulator of interferon genes protein [Spea bombifrons]